LHNCEEWIPMVALIKPESDALLFLKNSFLSPVFEKRSKIVTCDSKERVTKVLLLAQSFIKRGWCKCRYEISAQEQKEKCFGGLTPNYWENSEPRMCMVGAIRAAIT